MSENTEESKPVSSSQQTQTPSMTQRKVNGRIVVGIVLAVVALVLASLSALLPWWHVDSNVKGTGIAPPTFNWDFSTGTWCYRVSGNYQCKAYGGSSSTGGGWSGLSGSLGLGFIMLIVGAVMTALTLVMMVMSLRKQKARIAGLVIGILGTVILLGAALYVFATLPGAFTSDYRVGSPGTVWSVPSLFGTTSVNIDNGIYLGTMTINYYGWLGWWMAIVAAIVLLAGTIVACGRKSKVVQTPPSESPPSKAK